MSEVDNKERVRRLFEEVFNQGRLETADSLVHPECVNYAGPQDLSPGPAGVRFIAEHLRAAVPDGHREMHEMVAEGDLVAFRSTWRGTHRGVLFGLPPTGRSFVQTQMHLIRLKDGQMIEHWANRDDLGMMQQLGVIPMQPERPSASSPCRTT